MEKKFTCTVDAPVVETAAGKVRGYSLGNINVFKGIKYANAGRYRMPGPVEPWTGVKNTFSPGYVAPLINPQLPNPAALDSYRLWPESEDCHYLNVWTPSIDRNAKRPVMVWIYGGGYTHGSTVSYPATDGYNLSDFGDVVVVSFEHRINILGCLDLSDYGEQYAYTGTLVMEDCIAALRWVQENIAGFGGNSDNITIFGHSSGGAKVANLMQMETADGLYHKAISMCGIIPAALRPIEEHSKSVTEELLKALGIRKENVADIEKVPLDTLMGTFRDLMPEFRRNGIKAEWGVHPNAHYPGDAIICGLREHTKRIPFMTGTTIGEQWPMRTYPGRTGFTGEVLENALREKYGEQTETLKALFAEAYPKKDPSDLFVTDAHGRISTLDYLDQCIEFGHENCYNYMLALDFPYMGGMPAWHGAEIGFVFRNAQLSPLGNIPGVTDRMTNQLSQAWINFAKGGCPDNEYLSETWEPYRKGAKTTMIFDEGNYARCDYDRELVDLLEKTAPYFK